MSDFKSLNLHPTLLEALETKGYVTPTPIQAQTIPHVLEKKDLLGIAQTGTGKTAAFALPILHNLALNRVKTNPKHMRALILTPTRELASQIADNIKIYGKSFGFKHVVIFGGVGENPQIQALSKGVDIVIATPGRLLDLTNQGYVRYEQLEVFVLDEADRMLDMGFINDIRRIINYLPNKRQNLLFSATMPRDISDLAHSILRDPVRVEVTPQSTTVEKIEQSVCFVEKSNKPLLLKYILDKPEVTAALVFCRMKHSANKVEEFLEKNGIKAAAIHGNKTQGARERALKNFRDGQVKVLVATDIAARGIDIPLVSHVINYDVPQEPEAYVHRIGRTARAGREGVAISFCDSLERGMLKAVEKTIKKTIAVDDSHPYHGVAGVETSRKISSGKPVARGAGYGSRAPQAAKVSGSRIFSAKQSASEVSAVVGAEEVSKPRFERTPYNSDRKSPPRHRSDDSRRSEGRRDFKDRDSRPDSRSEPREGRVFDKDAKRGDRRPTQRKEGSSGAAGTFQGRPVHKRKSKTAGNKGWGYNSDRRNDHEANGSKGVITARLGKIVKWFAGKPKPKKK